MSRPEVCKTLFISDEIGLCYDSFGVVIQAYSGEEHQEGVSLELYEAKILAALLPTYIQFLEDELAE